MAPHRIRRWFQFGVLDLLILTAIVAAVAVLWRPPRIETYYEPLAEGTTPGQHWAGNGLRMKFRWCPPGQFKMGEPQNQVDMTLSRGFWLGTCEVTQGEYRQVMNDNPSFFAYEGRDAAMPAGIDADKLPVEYVSWDDAVGFCRLFAEQERKVGRLPPCWEYRLPTEAQWEYACRAGTTTATAFGDSLSSKQANFKGKPYNGGEPGPSLNRAAPVGSYAANAWGLHDMHGNTFEWCRDWYHPRLPGGADPDLYAARATAARSEHGDISRVRRGGAWSDDGWPCRSAFRLRFEPERRYDHIGFRVVVVQL